MPLAPKRSSSARPVGVSRSMSSVALVPTVVASIACGWREAITVPSRGVQSEVSSGRNRMPSFSPKES
jgi:hypothetical protein